MHRRGAALILILLVAPARDAQPSHRGMMAPADETILSASRAIDWTRSAGLFIGVQRFHRGSDLDAPYAVDDAVDLACAFTRGPHRLLRPAKTALLIAGLPFKESSRTRLAELRRDVMVIEDARGSFAHDFDCLNEETIVSAIRRQARSVEPGGVLVLSVATHGVLIEGEHRLLTADASADELHGISLARILRTVQEEHVERILLFIDACRRKPDRSWPSVSSWQPRTSGTFPEDEDLRLSYAVLVGAGPGGRAYADEFVGNGYFSRAVAEGLECTASAGPDGWLTLVNLESYVSKRVLQLSHGFQQTESRIGGLADLRLVPCERPCILSPEPGQLGGPVGEVEVQITQPDLFATVLICAVATNRCYNQNPEGLPIETREGEIFRLTVQYGTTGRYRVYVALTTDPRFLRDELEWPSLPGSRNAIQPVHWCGPVNVTLNPRPSGGKQ